MIAAILLQAAGGGLPLRELVTFALIGIVFYFFMIRPQVKKQKEQKKYVTELKKGDRVILTSGAHGRITDVNDATVLVEHESGHKTRYEKSAISLEASKALNTPAVTKA